MKLNTKELLAALFAMLLSSSMCLAGVNEDLMKATLKGSSSSVIQLLKSGADVNAKNNEGVTPLMVASGTGNKTILDILLSAGADVNATSNDGVTALMLAIYTNKISSAETLLKA